MAKPGAKRLGGDDVDLISNDPPYNVKVDGDEELALHPTVKPVALVGDAIRDCPKREAGIPDPFGGSGSTLIAADQAGRRGDAMKV